MLAAGHTARHTTRAHQRMTVAKHIWRAVNAVCARDGAGVLRTPPVSADEADIGEAAPPG